MIEKIFKNNNLKLTNQRRKIYNTILNSNANITIKEIIDNNQDIDISTIYRIIKVLLEHNIIIKDINYSNEIYYKINETHNHYINCIKCHKKIELEECPIAEVENTLKNNGFQILNHKIEINGICNSCNKN